MTKEVVNHEFGPFYRKNSECLILGTIPSVKSRAQGFYYMHPQNRFWMVLSRVYEAEYPETLDDKKRFLEEHKIALWDVLASCEIEGSSDSSISNIEVNDILSLLKKTKVKTIFTTGQKAYQLYMKYCYPTTKQKAILLPSTSPANCQICLAELVRQYQVLRVDKHLQTNYNIDDESRL